MRYITLLFIITLVACSQYRKADLTTQGNALVVRIDSFKTATNRLPESLKELGIEEKEEGPLYYQKIDSAYYIVWFETSLGESATYNSVAKRWQNVPR